MQTVRSFTSSSSTAMAIARSAVTICGARSPRRAMVFDPVRSRIAAIGEFNASPYYGMSALAAAACARISGNDTGSTQLATSNCFTSVKSHGLPSNRRASLHPGGACPSAAPEKRDEPCSGLAEANNSAPSRESPADKFCRCAATRSPCGRGDRTL